MEEEIVKAIRRIKNNKATGPDKIHGEIIKLIDGKALQILTYLFNLIYETGIIPSDWLKSTFIAIPKNQMPENVKIFGQLVL